MIKIVKSLKIQYDDVSILNNAVANFLSELTLPLLKEELYAAYICQQLYYKLRTKQNRMLDTGKLQTSITFDSIQSLVVIDVLTRYPASVRLNALLLELGSIAPKVKTKDSIK